MSHANGDSQLCLRLEQPQLQEIRDACADFFRKEEESNEPEEDGSSEDEDSDPEDSPLKVSKRRKHKHHLPSVWQSKREKAVQAAQPEESRALRSMVDNAPGMNDTQGTRIDFGTIDDKGEFQKSNMRVKICGRYIYNYPSQGAMKRKGWLHFSIIARGCSLGKAAELCKSWDEFFELNILVNWHYFPSPEWLVQDFAATQFQQIVSHFLSAWNGTITPSSTPARCR